MVEMPQEFTFGKYTFSEFSMLDNDTVRCKVQTNSLAMTEEDANNVSGIINNMGKWENVVKTGLNLLAELGIGNLSQATTQNNEIPFEIEPYEPRASLDGFNRCLWVFFSLTSEEYRRRENAQINPIIQPEEITSQLANIPKWKAFGKTVEIIKEHG
ncbi:MAG: hypothetical protein V1909_02855 [Candidatus Micrarchaeota archaeon]